MSVPEIVSVQSSGTNVDQQKTSPLLVLCPPSLAQYPDELEKLVNSSAAASGRHENSTIDLNMLDRIGLGFAKLQNNHYHDALLLPPHHQILPYHENLNGNHDSKNTNTNNKPVENGESSSVDPNSITSLLSSALPKVLNSLVPGGKITVNRQICEEETLRAIGLVSGFIVERDISSGSIYLTRPEYSQNSVPLSTLRKRTKKKNLDLVFLESTNTSATTIDENSLLTEADRKAQIIQRKFQFFSRSF